jgi:hypothetical protein
MTQIETQLSALREMEELCWANFARISKEKSFPLLEKQFNLMVNVRAQIRVLEALLQPATSNQ